MSFFNKKKRNRIKSAAVNTEMIKVIKEAKLKPTETKEKDIKQGENNGYAKLTNDEVEEIKKRYNTTSCTYRSLARDFGVSHSLIGGIIKGNFRNKENYILK